MPRKKPSATPQPQAAKKKEKGYAIDEDPEIQAVLQESLQTLMQEEEARRKKVDEEVKRRVNDRERMKTEEDRRKREEEEKRMREELERKRKEEEIRRIKEEEEKKRKVEEEQKRKEMEAKARKEFEEKKKREEEDKKRRLAEQIKKKEEEERQKKEEERRRKAEPEKKPEKVVQIVSNAVPEGVDLLGGLTDEEEEIPTTVTSTHRTERERTTYGMEEEYYSSYEGSAYGAQTHRNGVQRGSIDVVADEYFDHVNVDVTITKHGRLDGMYRFGSRILKLKLDNGQLEAYAGTQKMNVEDYISKFEKSEALRMKGLQAALPLITFLTAQSPNRTKVVSSKTPVVKTKA